MIADNQFLHFGRWPFPPSTDGGAKENLRPILWQKKGDDFFLSFYILDSLRWHRYIEVGDWHESELFNWLNGMRPGDFYQEAFTSKEKIALKANVDGDLGAYVTLPRNVAHGNVPASWGDLSAYGPAGYAPDYGNLAYWTRSLYGSYYAWYVDAMGRHDDYDIFLPMGLRPLCLIEMDTVTYRSGVGALEDPFELYFGVRTLTPDRTVAQGGTITIEFPGRVAHAYRESPSRSVLASRFEADGHTVTDAAFENGNLILTVSPPLKDAEAPPAVAYVPGDLGKNGDTDAIALIGTGCVLNGFEISSGGIVNATAPGLSRIELENVVLDPSFSPEIFSYWARVPASVNKILMTVEQDASDASVKINGFVLNGSKAYITLNPGGNRISIGVERNGAGNTYILSIISQDAE